MHEGDAKKLEAGIYMPGSNRGNNPIGRSVEPRPIIIMTCLYGN